MGDEPENVTLIIRRRFDGKMDRLTEDMCDLKRRATTLEIQVGGLIATEHSHYANAMLRLDRVENRLDRIERRLDLTAATADHA